MVDLNLHNKLMAKLVEINNFEPITLSKADIFEDIERIEVWTNVDDKTETVTFSFRKLKKEE